MNSVASMRKVIPLGTSLKARSGRIRSASLTRSEKNRGVNEHETKSVSIAFVPCICGDAARADACQLQPPQQRQPAQLPSRYGERYSNHRSQRSVDIQCD